MHEPIFLVGAPRSGTTLLVELLNRHKDIYVFNETVFYDALINARSKHGEDHGQMLSALVAHLCERVDVRTRPEGDNREDFGGRLTPVEAANAKSIFRESAGAIIEAQGQPAELLSLFMSVVASIKGKSIWGEKTPSHLFMLGDILKDFPAARIVNVVRDPASFVISYKYSWRQHGGNEINRHLYHPLVTSLQWRRSVKSFQKQMGSDRASQCKSVRYEDLVGDMQDVMTSVCEFLGVEHIDALVIVKGSNTSFSGKRERLTRFEQGVCNAICGAAATANGYIYHPGVGDYIMVALSFFTLPAYLLRIIPIMRARFGGSFLRYLAARNIIPGLKR